MTILYIHDFGDSATGKSVQILRKAFPQHTVIAAPIDNDMSNLVKHTNLVNQLIRDMHVDIVVGYGLGGYTALRAVNGIPKFLINPVFNPTQYAEHNNITCLVKYPEVKDGDYDIDDKCITYGFFGEFDTKVNCQYEFSQILYDTNGFVIPGKHDLTEERWKPILKFIQLYLERRYADDCYFRFKNSLRTLR